MQGLRKFINGAYNLPKGIKILISIVLFFPVGWPIFLFFFFIFVPALKQQFDLEDRGNELINNPTEENVLELMKCLEKAGINNHPDTWQRMRGLWNVVNKSNQITTPTKEKFIAQLIAKGLYINNTNVIDNYGKPYKEQQTNRQNENKQKNRRNTNSKNHSNNHSDDDFLQEEIERQQNEWAMEEARKSVTPFDIGGYVQGDGFNPSDTMAADAQREQMDQMNDMNNMGMF